MAPTYQELAARPGYGPERAALVAWQVGLVACFLSGLIEAAGALFAGWVRRVTPRAALLSTLAGIALGFISMEFALKTFDRPLVAMAPLAIVLLAYLGRFRWPFGLPGGLVAVLAGTLLAWGLALAGIGGRRPWPSPASGKAPACGSRGPRWAISRRRCRAPSSGNGWRSSCRWALINVLGSLQNVESAEAEGDVYPTGRSLFVNGAATVVAAALRLVLPDHDLHRPSRVEADGRRLGLLGLERPLLRRRRADRPDRPDRPDRADRGRRWRSWSGSRS